MLEFHSLKKSYRDRQILNIPEFRLNRGVYWLEGTNGSGKTTLLRILAGVIPFEGNLLFGDISLQHQPLAYRNRIGWSEAEPAYPDFISGKELVEFYRYVRKASAEDTANLIQWFGISSYLDAPTGSYSSGMKKRLSLLLAFIGNPQLILLDEPLSTLDMEIVTRLPKLIADYHQHQGTSFIFTSHHSVDTIEWSGAHRLLVDRQTITRVDE